MNNVKININFDCFTIHQIPVTMVITKCIKATLAAQNVLVKLMCWLPTIGEYMQLTLQAETSINLRMY